MEEKVQSSEEQAKPVEPKKDNKVKWGCLGCLGVVALFFIICSVIPLFNSSETTTPDQQKTISYLLNKQGWLEPGQQINYSLTFEQGGVVGELLGYNSMLKVRILRGSDKRNIPFTILTNRETFTRIQWKIPTSESYNVYIENTSDITKTDYIIKMWKGNWKHSE